MIIDAWIQHPTPAMLNDPMFDAINLVQKLPATKPASFVPLPVKNKW